MELAIFGKGCEEARRALLSYAYACCRDLDWAEDIVQDALVIAFQKRDQFFPEADFHSWLISIVRNVWLRERERRSRHDKRRKFLEENAALLFEADDYNEERWDQERRALRQCLEKLSPVDLSIIHAHFGQNHKYADIACRMQRTVSWVKMRMCRSRVALLQCVRLEVAKVKGTGFEI